MSTLRLQSYAHPVNLLLLIRMIVGFTSVVKSYASFEKTYHRLCSKVSVLVIQVQVYCQLFVQRSRQRRDCRCSGASVTTCCHSGTTQKTRVVCLAYAVQICNILAQDSGIVSCHGKIPPYTGNQKQQSADKVTSNRLEKLRFGQCLD